VGDVDRKENKEKSIVNLFGKTINRKEKSFCTFFEEG